MTAVSPAIALDDSGIEDRVEAQWFACRIDRKSAEGVDDARSDAAGFANFGPWLVLLVGSGGVAWLAWAAGGDPAFFVYGTLYTLSDAHWHECAHGTALSDLLRRCIR